MAVQLRRDTIRLLKVTVTGRLRHLYHHAVPRALFISAILLFPSNCLAQSQYWMQTSYVGAGVSRLLSNTTGTVIARASNMVIRSTDNGISWNECRGYLYNITRNSNNDLYGGLLNSLYKSSDDGVSWPEIHTVGSYETLRGGLAADTSGLIIANYDYIGPGRYYEIGSVLSSDNGLSWQHLNMVASLYAIQPGTKLFAVSGSLYSSIDKGITWNHSDSGLTSNVLCIEFFERNTILAGTYIGLFRSLDGGGFWTRVGLDNIIVYSLATNFEGEIFAGTSRGIFHSSDTTRTWVQENSGLTDTTIVALTVGPQGYVFAATSTAGIYRTVGPTTSVKEKQLELPQSFLLEQNYPNPFNPATHIQYQLPKESKVTLKVYNILGQPVSTLVDEVQSPGNKSVAFDGSRLPSGVYMYRLTVGNHIYARKMILMK